MLQAVLKRSAAEAVAAAAAGDHRLASETEYLSLNERRHEHVDKGTSMEVVAF